MGVCQKLPEISCTKPAPLESSTTGTPSGIDCFFPQSDYLHHSGLKGTRRPLEETDRERGGGIVTFHPQGALDETVTH
ncbi:hypothetical protein BV898_16953 [Hypsibius exemplaris]|uniref:Uncharacterized protein n=1 Tax=Hypsibius exemplaris TaxID=2072580 RepID=A0A9X6NH18_HYPEX|nr:hypothetical protein BV898_16953 [Hypsibius exemplaris]